jgi:hypothetical protein
MKRYIPSRGGHAPGVYRDAFLDAVDAIKDWEPRKGSEPMVELNAEHVPATLICGLLWHCSDPLPGMASTALKLDRTAKPTYGNAARRLLSMIVRRSPRRRHS